MDPSGPPTFWVRRLGRGPRGGVSHRLQVRLLHGAAFREPRPRKARDQRAQRKADRAAWPGTPPPRGSFRSRSGRTLTGWSTPLCVEGVVPATVCMGCEEKRVTRDPRGRSIGAPLSTLRDKRQVGSDPGEDRWASRSCRLSSQSRHHGEAVPVEETWGILEQPPHPGGGHRHHPKPESGSQGGSSCGRRGASSSGALSGPSKQPSGGVSVPSAPCWGSSDPEPPLHGRHSCPGPRCTSPPLSPPALPASPLLLA